MSRTAAPAGLHRTDVEEAARWLSGRVVRTPVLRSPVIDQLAGARVLFKAENLQNGGSYKMRARCGRSAGSPPPATPG
ncbi:hypothetical protein GCM10027614_36970 [Micromonospora vulcania]